MATTNYFDHIIDPVTGNRINVMDKYAREQLVHKTEKTVVNSLPAKPTTEADWLAMEKFLYYVPIEGQDDSYDAWTLFFIGDPEVAADYTDPDKYEWVKISQTNADMTNFSTKSHTHEVVTEVEVEDHDYTPQGTVSGQFTGGSSETSSNGTHTHDFTPSGSVSSSFSGTQGTTGNNGSHTHSFTPSGSVSSSFTGSMDRTSQVSDHRHSYTPSGSVSAAFSGTEELTDVDGRHTHRLSTTPKKLGTLFIDVSPSTTVNFSGSTTDAKRATGSLESLSSYDASKAVLNGIEVIDGGLSFIVKKMSTADTVSGLSATVDASKVLLNNLDTYRNGSMATGSLVDPTSALDPSVIVGVEIFEGGSHTHSYTPKGNITASFTGTQGATSDEGAHEHTFTPSGTVSSSFSGTAGDTGNAGAHEHTFTPSGSVSSSFSGTQGTTGNGGAHTHTVTPQGNVEATFSGLRTKLKHNVDNKKVRTAPDSEDEGSHAFDWYGILFDEDEADPHKTRVGNMDMHRMLPIQTKMRRCLLNDDGTVNYYLDDRDSTKKAGSQEGWVTDDETFMSRVETDDIRDETEYVDEIKGNSVVWNQLTPISLTDLSKSANGVTIIDNRDGSYTIYTTDEGASANADLLITAQKTIIQTHSIFLFGAPQGSGSATAELRLQGITGSGTGADGAIYKVTSSTTAKPFIRVYANAIIPQSAPLVFRPMHIDLTLIFGAGNEPATVAQFEAWLAQNVGLRDYYPYDAGSIVNMDMSGIKTVKADGVTERNYPFDVKKIYGKLNGAGELTQVFPDGMKAAGQVRDELTAQGAVKRIGSVDLGQLNWSYIGEGGDTPYFSSAEIQDIKTVASNNEVGNLLCSIYNLATWLSYIDRTIKQKADSHRVGVIDSSYTSSVDFKSAMDGVMLNYELADYLTYTDLVYRDNGSDIPFVEHLLSINAERNGTITILPQTVNNVEQMLAAPTLSMRKYALTIGARLDGSDGQVMVEIPEHWRKVYTYLDGAKTMVKAMISPYPQNTTGWVHVRKGYMSAYEASVADNKLCSVSDVKDLVLSVVDGKVNATCDVSVIGETGAPSDWAAYIATNHSLFPTTNKMLASYRTYARARGNEGEFKWNAMVYEQYLAIYWLFVIEYANLNSQEAFNGALDRDGFHQGGLGVGATNAQNWTTFNSATPFIPCGITNCLGNHSGEVILSIPSTLNTNGKIAVNSYRGIELPFGHIWKLTDGIKYIGDGTQQTVLRCENPTNYSSEESLSNYVSMGTNIGSNGYKKKILVYEDGDINCKEVGGGALKSFCDYNYQEAIDGKYYCLLVGNNVLNGTDAGLCCLRTNVAITSKGNENGTRLSYFEK